MTDQLEIAPRCPWCDRLSDRLCDGRVVPDLSDQSKDAGTCNSPVCVDCTEATEISAIVCKRGGRGRGCEHIKDTIDLCPLCWQRKHAGENPIPREAHEVLLRRHQHRAQGPQHGERVWVVDANNMVHRLYHAVPPMTSPTGAPINAVVGWVRSLRRLRAEHGVKWLLPIFDGPGDGWRHELHPGYKAGRSEQDEDLQSQWPLVVRLTAALRLPPISIERVEADDLVAAYTEALVARGCEVVIVSNDKDLMQLVRGDGPGSVRQLARGRDGLELRGQAEALAKWGVYPEELGDLLALAGDTVDSIPGVAGVGPKTAAKLLRERGSLEAVLDNAALIPGKLGLTLLEARADARLSRRLVALQADTPLPLDLGELRPWVPSRIALDDFFRELGYPRFEAAVDAYQGPT